MESKLLRNGSKYQFSKPCSLRNLAGKILNNLNFYFLVKQNSYLKKYPRSTTPGCKNTWIINLESEKKKLKFLPENDCSLALSYSAPLSSESETLIIIIQELKRKLWFKGRDWLDMVLELKMQYCT